MIDIIGIINKPTGVTLQDEDGNDYNEQIAVEGYHVNCTEQLEEWTDYEVTPSTPRRLFAGVDTYFYSFADKAEFDSVNPEKNEEL